MRTACEPVRSLRVIVREERGRELVPLRVFAGVLTVVMDICFGHV